MSFIVGETAVLKTTGEKVIVLGTLTIPGQPAPTVNVRRPIATKDNGLVHVDNTFFEFELETFEQQLTREFAEAKKVDDLRNQLMAETKAADTQSSKVSFVN